MIRSWLVFCAGAGVAILASAGAIAQEPLDIDAVRKLPSIDAASRDVITKWVESKLKQVQATDDRAEIAKLGAEFVTMWRAPETTQAFRDAFAPVASDRFSAVLAESKADHARMMVRVLAQLAHTSAFAAFAKALGHVNAGARYWAAAGIASLHGKLSPGDVQTAIDALRQAGEKENESLVVRQIYLALGFDVRVDDTTSATLAVLNARITRYLTSRTRWADAELAALEVLGKWEPKLPDRAKVRIVQTLAKLLRVAWGRYANAEKDTPTRANIERVIEDAEALLKRIVRDRTPATKLPDMAGAMKDEPKTRKIDAMKLALNEWAGTERIEGLLNREPWNVPRQVGITTQPAPVDAEKVSSE